MSAWQYLNWFRFIDGLDLLTYGCGRLLRYRVINTKAPKIGGYALQAGTRSIDQSFHRGSDLIHLNGKSSQYIPGKEGIPGIL